MKKYLLYGIGEILLVMVGILLALQVNNWNEYRKDRLKEQMLLRELRGEFLNNIEKIEQQNARLLENIDFHRSFIQRLTQGNPSLEMICRFNGGGVITVGTTNPSFGVINSLLSTGDIALISNDSLRNKISNWKDVLVDFTEDEELHLQYFLDKMVPYFRENFLISFSEGKELSFYDISSEEIERDKLAITREKKYRSMVINNLEWIKGNLESGKNTLERLKDILTLIEREIK